MLLFFIKKKKKNSSVTVSLFQIARRPISAQTGQSVPPPFLALCTFSSFVHGHAVLQETAEEEMLEPEEPVEDGRPSSAHLLRLRRRAFMKKLLTVESSSPSCCEMVTCSSLVGRWFSRKMASSVRRCRSVKTSRVRLGPWLRSSLLCSCSFLLHAAWGTEREGGGGA